MTFEVLLPCLTREMATVPWGIHIALGLGCEKHILLLFCIESTEIVIHRPLAVK